MGRLVEVSSIGAGKNSKTFNGPPGLKSLKAFGAPTIVVAIAIDK